MNDNAEAPQNRFQPEVIQAPLVPPKRPRWRRLLLWSLLGVVVLTVLGGIGWVAYWHHLIRTYTTTQPLSLTTPENGGELAETTKKRIQEFFYSFQQGETPSALELNEDQLNAMAAQNSGLSNRVQLSIINDKIIGKFSFPLDNLKQSQLKGRFLNGSFHLDIQFLDATLSVFLLDVKANGKPLPRWAQNRLRKFNLVRDMYRQPDAVGFLQNLDALEVKDRVLRICPRDRSWLGY